MKLSRSLALLVLTAVAMIGCIVLIALGHTVPDFLTFTVVTGVGAVAGVSIPDNAPTADASSRGVPLPAPERT